MMHYCAIDFGINWEKYVPLMEFAKNNSYHDNLKMSPFESLYGRRCGTSTFWIDISERKIVGPDLMRETKEKVVFICNHLKVA